MLSLNQHTRQYTYQIPECHNKLNQYGKLALQSKQESYSSIYHSMLKESQTSRSTKKVGEQALSTLLLSHRSRSQLKKMNPELQMNIQKLQELGLNTPKELKHIKYEGSIKIPTVHNDYHARGSNRGYSRSETGGIFPK